FPYRGRPDGEVRHRVGARRAQERAELLVPQIHRRSGPPERPMSGTIDGQFTLGVEEEYQIVHPETRDLRSYISRILEDGKSVLRERVRTEMHQSMVEVGTSVCPDVSAVRSELLEMRGELDRLARKGGLRIIAASTHPFSDWKAQEITDNPRYHT